VRNPFAHAALADLNRTGIQPVTHSSKPIASARSNEFSGFIPGRERLCSNISIHKSSFADIHFACRKSYYTMYGLFWVTRVKQMANPAPSSPAPGPIPASARRCVLIVEDNPLNMKLFSAMIASQGYDVLQASDGHGGLDLAHQQHPDLIIMDIQLPGMSGLEVTHNLKADVETRDIPIIATTAYALRGDEEKIRASGCDGYMAKPIAISEFLDLVRSFMTASREAPHYVA
jgi:two-component system, cell cycle response regulator DivK